LDSITVSVYTRHGEVCDKKADSTWRRCRCMKWLYVNENGKRRQVSGGTRSWDRAQEKARELEDEAKRRAAAAARAEMAEPKNELMTAEEAVEEYLEDKRQQNCEPATVKKLEIIFRKQFLNFLSAKGLVYLTKSHWGTSRNSGVSGKTVLSQRKRNRSECLVSFASASDTAGSRKIPRRA